MSGRRWIWRLHGVTGLAGGAGLLIVGLTGSLLVFAPQLDAWTGQRLRATTHVVTTPLDPVVASVRTAHPDAVLDGITWPRFPGDPLTLRWHAPDGRQWRTDHEPATGAALTTWERHAVFSDWVRMFHWSLQLGSVGALLTALLGIALLVSGITGLVIARRWWRLLRRPDGRPRPARARLGRLHTLVGIGSLGVNLILGATAVYFNAFAFRDLRAGTLSWRTTSVRATPAVAPSLPSIDRAVARATAAVPGLAVRYIDLPSTADDAIELYGRLPAQSALFDEFGTQVSVDPQTLAVRAARSLRDATWTRRLAAMSGPLHYGTFGGRVTQWLWALVGLTPGLLAITGTRIWWQRGQRLSRGDAPRPLSPRAPPRRIPSPVHSR